MDQRGEIDAGRKTPMDFFRHGTDQRQIGLDHLVPRLLIHVLFRLRLHPALRWLSTRRKKNCRLPLTRTCPAACSSSRSAIAENARAEGDSAKLALTICPL